MKFSDLTREQWTEWRPYLDTCLLPITGLTGLESPVEAAERLGELRDWLDLVETPFHGRVVTYPAYHYSSYGTSDREDTYCVIQEVVRMVKRSGFKYVIIMSCQSHISKENLSEADLVVTPYSVKVEDGKSIAEMIETQVSQMWNSSQTDH
ncbi:DUF2487 family protein [Paenibacillus arenosi]|uniref:DUF2487 family protein n=1 Tax=Paenibacillus arenosi TaxID=2774142 RepID=A0ABR9AXB6_9BACL|nr:DUF2487 family protein [Paenibacillus arenosi]MBD8497601.1 DUF2487 family protein [Paenibacillus arenosi]